MVKRVCSWIIDWSILQIEQEQKALKLRAKLREQVASENPKP